MEAIGKLMMQAWNSAHAICDKMTDGSLCKSVCSILVLWLVMLPPLVVVALVM